MSEVLACLLADGYKFVHPKQYNPKVNFLASYMTPRSSRLEEDKMVFFGLQGFCKTYLIDYFNNNFFNLPREEVEKEAKVVLDHILGEDVHALEQFMELYDLGYLPIQVRALPEGTRVPMKVPCLEITNTHPKFYWLVQWVESLLSSEIWKPCVDATIAYMYREIVNEWYDKTVDESVDRRKAMSDFGFRGMSCVQEAIKTSSAWLCSFTSTATIPAIPYIKKMYNLDKAGTSAISTEHSVMCSNAAIDGDERTFLKRLLAEIYHNQSFSVVCDSYDYDNVLENVLPSLKDEIMAHNGTLLVRGDSGDPVDVICGDWHKLCKDWSSLETLEKAIKLIKKHMINNDKKEIFFEYKGKYYKATGSYKFKESDYGFALEWTEFNVEEYSLTTKNKGTVQMLWETFGGTINSKGYKVLDPHIRAIYGDSITLKRAKEIYRLLEEQGFAAENAKLGVGSFSFHCVEEDGMLKPLTRDTFSVAIKATYCECEQENKLKSEKYFIFKNPKESGFKKSPKGMIQVRRGLNGELEYKDEFYRGESQEWDHKLFDKNELKTVFKDGKMVKEVAFDEVRETLWNGKF